MRYVRVSAWILTILGAAGAAQAADNPTFTKDVAPILYKSCVECHRPTMFAPMSLMTFDDARPWARVDQAARRRRARCRRGAPTRRTGRSRTTRA